ncbi:MAG: radical SAM protein, partial [Kiritimatiellae bacterium]|nr:radical SAM protein [Kiritimatiellia bacterium]
MIECDSDADSDFDEAMSSNHLLDSIMPKHNSISTVIDGQDDELRVGIRSLRVLLLTPPMVQLNAPYAATPLLTGFLRANEVDARQADWSLKAGLTLFSRRGVGLMAEEAERIPCAERTEGVGLFLSRVNRYADSVDDVVAFLQQNDSERARRILDGPWLPEGPRFRLVGELRARGCAPYMDDDSVRARFLASLYLDDLADVIREGVDPHFGFSKYAEQIALSADSFSPLCRELEKPFRLMDRLLEEWVGELAAQGMPDLIGMTIPFPGNVYAAFRIAQCIRRHAPGVHIAAGGGYVNTEWRTLSDPRVFDYLDYILYDDGELPLLRLVKFLEGKSARNELVRTRLLENGRVTYVNDPGAPELRHRDRPAPCFEGLDLQRYCPMIESPNPMHRLWSDRCWIKMTLAHGCYWHRCAFCDTSLDYIRRYDPAPAVRIVEWIEQVIAETGRRDFHFVDEAAPPALLRRLAEILIDRNIQINWWTNIRFERAFNTELASLLARAGCLAVTGGMECAEDRLLTLMNKGVTLKGMAQAARSLADAGILVHAYLMYGFPTETRREIVDALEYVRQLFAA